MVGMIYIDAWKVSRLQENNDLKIKDYSAILAADMIDAAKNGGDSCVDVVIEAYGSIATASDMFSLVSPTSYTHTQVLLEDMNQVRCISCNRVHLIERKTTTK